MNKSKTMQITLTQLVDMFVSTKQSEGKSSKTTNWYRGNLQKFIDWKGSDARLADLTLLNARAFVVYLQGRTTRYDTHPMSRQVKGGLSPHSIHAYVRTLKVFSSWLAEEEFLPSDPLAKLKRPKLPETLVEVLTEDEQRKIFAELNPNCFSGARLTTIVTLLLDTGIRAEELLGLTLDRTDLEACRIKVKGKGNKERIVPFGTATKKTLFRYLSLWRPETENYQVFTDGDGNPLTYTALSHMLMRLGKRVDIPRLHAHLLRHTFSVSYLMSGGDLQSLRMILGHTDIGTTQLYLKLSNMHVSNQYHAHSPMDRLGKKTVA